MAKQVKKGAKGTNRIDTLLAAIAEWIGVPKRSNIGKLINPPPPANVPIVVAKTPYTPSCTIPFTFIIGWL